MAGELLAHLGRLTGLCFERLPDLSVLSLFSPELQSLVLGRSPVEGYRAAVEDALLGLASEARRVRAALRPLGDIEGLPHPWPGMLRQAVAGGEGSRTVNFFLNYSSRREIAAAAESCLREGLEESLDEKVFSARLLTTGQPDPDLLIFAGGHLEPKDFLLWQASYAEIWHRPGSGLDFDDAALAAALDSYLIRQRRFGRV